MGEVGSFRIVSAEDLAAFRYQGKRGLADADIKALCAQGLARQSRITVETNQVPITVVTLTKAGLQAVVRNRTAADINPQQLVWRDLVKPREIGHDVQIYRMYQTEAGKIRNSGGTVDRVILDYQLKRQIYAPLAKERPRMTPADFTNYQAQIAAAADLRVVNGRFHCLTCGSSIPAHRVRPSIPTWNWLPKTIAPDS